MKRPILSALVALLGLIGAALLVMAGTLSAQGTGEETTPECVPKDAWTEIIEHPAVTHIEQVLVDPGSPAVPAVPGFWTNFQPNDKHAPFDGPPSYPSDPRGSWSDPKVEGGPQQDASGVYQNGHGHGSWFYRSQGTPEIPEVPPTHEDKIVVDKEAWTETIEHPAVTCPTETATVTETTDTPTEPTETVTITPPTETVTVTPPTETVTVTPPPVEETPCIGRPVADGPCGDPEAEEPLVPQASSPEPQADALPSTGGPMLYAAIGGVLLVLIGTVMAWRAGLLRRRG